MPKMGNQITELQELEEMPQDQPPDKVCSLQ